LPKTARDASFDPTMNLPTQNSDRVLIDPSITVKVVDARGDLSIAAGPHFAFEYDKQKRKCLPMTSGGCFRCHEDGPDAVLQTLSRRSASSQPADPDGEFPTHHYSGIPSKFGNCRRDTSR
jgi:hypothetical protein